MIFQTLLHLFFNGVFFILDKIPFLNFTVQKDMISTFIHYVDLAGYFVPLDIILLCIGVLISIEAFKIALSLIKLIFEFLPFF